MNKNRVIFSLLICITTAFPLLAQEETIYPIAIVGAGAGGTMAAKRAVLNNREVVLFTGAKKEMKRSRGHWVRKVDNIPGLAKYSRTIVDLRKQTLKEIERSPQKDRLHVVADSVKSITNDGSHFTLTDKAGKSYRARYVILATGMMDEQPYINGSIKPILPFANKQLIAYCLLCDGHKSLNKKTAVIGHSEDAASGALLLADRYNPPKLTLLTNGVEPKFSEEMLAKLSAKKVAIVTSPIKQIVGNKKKKVLTGFEVKSGELVEADVGFVSLGIRPNNSLAIALGASLDNRGLVLTDANGESSIANLFVIGDLRANSLKQIYTAWQHAVDALQIIDRRLRTQTEHNEHSI